MPDYKAPVNDFQFLLHHWLKLENHYQRLGLQEFDQALVDEILNQGAKFAEEAIAPLNQPGDEQGCQLNGGKVTTPEGFGAAYQEYVENGWNSMLGSGEYDGQDLPYSMAVPFHEMLNSANLSWRLVSMLTESAILALTKHGDDGLKNQYLPKLISGEWTGTMCLTEPQAGTDLALLNCKAEDNGDGSFAISGSKIFISGGDQDWTDNIIHMVLARLPDAPPGVKGISLFLVPKVMESGSNNSLSVGSIEKKMGIKGCPTCVMNFDGATGWLVGGPNQGLACMFTMMNDARFQVGLQGLGIAEAASQGALTYALERLQSRAPQGVQNPEGKADPIAAQPDVRRMLLTQQSLTQGCRALAMIYAMQMDREKFGDAEAKAQASALLSFLTPITKAFMTDVSQEASNLGIQVYGGHGYIREWGMEQLVRDSRITQLYEGTNGIQSLDLIGRKLVRDGGHLQQITHDYLLELVAGIRDANHNAQAKTLLAEWDQDSKALLGAAPDKMAANAHDYLQYSSYKLIGVLWHCMADAATDAADQTLAAHKQQLATFYLQRVLPRAELHRSQLDITSDDLLAVNW